MAQDKKMPRFSLIYDERWVEEMLSENILLAKYISNLTEKLMEIQKKQDRGIPCSIGVELQAFQSQLNGLKKLHGAADSVKFVVFQVISNKRKINDELIEELESFSDRLMAVEKLFSRETVTRCGEDVKGVIDYLDATTQ